MKKAEKIAVFKMDSIHLLIVCILNIVAHLGLMFTGGAKDLTGRVHKIFKSKGVIPYTPKFEIVPHFLHQKVPFWTEKLIFRLKNGHLWDNSSSGRVQCTRCWNLTGANAPAAPVLTPPLMLMLKILRF